MKKEIIKIENKIENLRIKERHRRTKSHSSLLTASSFSVTYEPVSSFFFSSISPISANVAEIIELISIYLACIKESNLPLR